MHQHLQIMNQKSKFTHQLNSSSRDNSSNAVPCCLSTSNEERTSVTSSIQRVPLGSFPWARLSATLEERDFHKHFFSIYAHTTTN